MTIVINPRTNIVPENTIVLYTKDGILPSDYAHETVLFNKFLENVPTAGTNPGSGDGTATHDHGVETSTHTHGSTATSHFHTSETEVNLLASEKNGGGAANVSPRNHRHTLTWTSTTPSLGTSDTAGGGSHGTDASDLDNITVRHIFHSNTIIGLRKKNLPRDTTIFWSDLIANIPTDYTSELSLYDKYLKGVPDASTAPGVSGTGGENTHGIVSGSTHPHGVTIASHTHTFVSNNHPGQGAGPAANVVSHTQHDHPVGTAAFSSDGGTGTSDTDGSHTHGLINNEPFFHKLIPITKNKISLRRTGIPPLGIVEWLGTIANIPSLFAITDGIGDTVNLIDRYIKMVPNGTTESGDEGGGDIHTHPTDGAHTHNVDDVNHTHTQSGTLASAGGQNIIQSGGGSFFAASSHLHDLIGISDASNATGTLTSGGTHAHGSASNKPVSLTVALIQRV
jgi:hypothetical protein